MAAGRRSCARSRGALVLAAVALLASSAVWSQAEYPSRPIRLLIPFPSGGAADMIARTIGERLTAQVGQPMVYDNRPGAGGVVSADLLAKAAPDGYTVMVGTPGAMVIAPLLSTRLSYVPQRDFIPVTRVSEVLNVMVVNPGIGAKSVEEFVAWARKRSGDVRYGSSGPGQNDHLAGEFFARLTGAQMIHVPYKGTSAAVSDLVGGQIDMLIDNLPGVLPQVRAGKLRALALTSPTRSKAAPDVPSAGEAGMKDLIVSGWFGFLSPAKTPAPVNEWLAQEMIVAARSPEVQAQFADLGGELDLRGPAEFRAYLRAESDRWAKIIGAAKLAIPQ